MWLCAAMAAGEICSQREPERARGLQVANAAVPPAAVDPEVLREIVAARKAAVAVAAGVGPLCGVHRALVALEVLAAPETALALRARKGLLVGHRARGPQVARHELRRQHRHAERQRRRARRRERPQRRGRRQVRRARRARAPGLARAHTRARAPAPAENRWVYVLVLLKPQRLHCCQPRPGLLLSRARRPSIYTLQTHTPIAPSPSHSLQPPRCPIPSGTVLRRALPPSPSLALLSSRSWHPWPFRRIRADSAPYNSSPTLVITTPSQGQLQSQSNKK